MSSGIWIRLHVDLFEHPKTARLARRLEINKVQTVGHLAALWSWALRYAPAGEITAYDADEIADGALWDGDSKRFLEELEACKWLERNDRGEVRIHDWEEYGGRLLETKIRNRERAREYREKRAEPKADPDREAMQERTPEPTRKAKPKTPKVSEAAIAGSFARFWRAYPKKASKADALKAWEKLKPSAELEAEIHTGLAAAKSSDQWTREAGRFIPHAATWINGRRWEDGGTEPASRRFVLG